MKSRAFEGGAIMSCKMAVLRKCLVLYMLAGGLACLLGCEDSSDSSDDEIHAVRFINNSSYKVVVAWSGSPDGADPTVFTLEPGDSERAGQVLFVYYDYEPKNTVNANRIENDSEVVFMNR